MFGRVVAGRGGGFEREEVYFGDEEEAKEEREAGEVKEEGGEVVVEERDRESQDPDVTLEV